MKTATIYLYAYSELTPAAQQVAFNNHENFLLELGQEVENENGKMVTEYPESIERCEVIDSIEANEYMFYYDGQMAHTVTYTGKHPKSGVTELKFHGETYTL